MITILLNIIWLIFGGLIMALSWCVYGILMFISIVGIPWGRACFVIGLFMLWPFGRQAVERKNTGFDIGIGPLGLIGNIIWFFIAGFWLAIGHIMTALFYFVTIIGIPFGLQHIKFAQISLLPIGKTVISNNRG